MSFMNKWIGIALLALLTAWACNNSDEDPIEPEIPTNVTTLDVSLLQIGTTDTIRLHYADLDGPGGNAPTIQGGTLDTNALYFVVVEVSDESVSPSVNVTDSISINNSDFQFFFITDNLNLEVSYADQDSGGFPLGLFTTFTTGTASAGNLVINLTENPNKTATGVAEGQLQNAGGKTVIQVNFPVTIE